MKQALTVSCPVCRAAVDVRCAEAPITKVVERKVNGKRMCVCGLVETLHASLLHAFQAETVAKTSYVLVDRRCAEERAKKAAEVGEKERDQQSELFWDPFEETA